MGDRENKNLNEEKNQKKNENEEDVQKENKKEEHLTGDGTTTTEVTQPRQESSSFLTPNEIGKQLRTFRELDEELEMHLNRIRQQIPVYKQVKKTIPNISRKISGAFEEIEEAMRKVDRIRGKMGEALLVQQNRVPIAVTPKTTPVSTPNRNRKGQDTPSSTTRKRGRQERDSPENTRDGKKARTDETKTYSQAVKQGKANRRNMTKEGKKGPPFKKKNEQRPRKERNEAVIIKPQDGKTYDDLVNTLKQKMKPEDVGDEIVDIHKTRAGYMLVELKKGAANIDSTREHIRTAVQEAGLVRNLTPRMEIELGNLDSTTTEEDVKKGWLLLSTSLRYQRI